VRTWPGRKEPQVFTLHLPVTHQVLLVDDVSTRDGVAKVLVVNSFRQDGTPSTQHIPFQHDYQVLFEEQRVRFLSTRDVSLTYQIVRKESSRQEWWWYTR
jgi:hypothetical protein